MKRTEAMAQVDKRSVELIRMELAGEIDHTDIRNWIKSSADHLELAALHVAANHLGVTEASH